MANQITLLKDFINGQGAGASNYVVYAQDLDSNFQVLESAVNQLVAEVKAVQGPNALLGLDILQINDPNGPVGTQLEGVIGEHSMRVTINSGDSTLLDVAGGAAIVNGQRVSRPSTTQLVGSGTSGTRWVAIDVSAQLSLETAANQQDLDLASVEWNGSAFVAPVTQLAEIFLDGDAWDDLLTREATGAVPTFPAFDYRQPDARVGDLERFVAGVRSGATVVGGALGPGGIPGTAATPGWVTTDGTTWDTGTGLFRAAADALGFAAGGTEIARVVAQGVLAGLTGTAVAPVFSRTADPDTGVFFPGFDQVSFAAGGSEVMRAQRASGNDQLLIAVGSAAAPGRSFFADPDTGSFSPGPNRYAIATNGVLRLEIDASGAVDLPTNPRVRTTRNGQTITGGSLTNLAFDTEVFDVGGWHDNVTNNDQHVVPADGDGVYAITGHVRFLESTAAGGGAANAGTFRQLQVEVDGSAVDLPGDRVANVTSGNTEITTSGVVALTAGQVVRLQADHDNGGTMDVDAELTIVKLA